MAILQIIQYPDLRLGRRGKLVTDVMEEKIQRDIHNMIQTLLASQKCAALAATQLAMDNPPSITVINTSDKPTVDNVLCLVNPQIMAKEGEVIDMEGCMSVLPEFIYAPVMRAKKIKVKALDHRGNNLEFHANDFLARCIQHEYDHLQGIVYLDHLSKEERLIVEQKISTLARSN